MAKNPFSGINLPFVEGKRKEESVRSREASATRLERPFAVDPSNTQEFTALGANAEAAGRNSHIKAVVIGGGTGQPMSIRALLKLGVETSCVVAMADDGGSTGLLRQEARVTPPGDIRKCIAAMAADPDDPLTRAFKYRFSFARNHTLGNLMLCALEEAASSFPEAIAICERLLNARGHVYPSTLDHVTLSARTRDGQLLDGQAIACHSDTALQQVWLNGLPEEGSKVEAYAPAVKAIREADLIVLGPGSLFTSIIPNLLVPGIVDAIRQSKGKVLFVCGLADAQGETWGLTAKEHLEALYDHGMRGLVDYMLVHSTEELRPDSQLQGAWESAVGEGGAHEYDVVEDQINGHMVKPVRITYKDAVEIQNSGPVLVLRNLSDEKRPTWHSPKKLLDAIEGVMRLCRLPLR